MKKSEFEVLVALERIGDIASIEQIAEEIGFSRDDTENLMHGLTESGFVSNGKITNDGIAALEPYRVKRAVIMAAGFGSRMVPITYNTPKPMVRVHGKRMIDTLLDAILAAGIRDIVIVRGYLGEQFDQLLYKYPMIRFIENPIYSESNTISSLAVARYLLQNAYVMEADFVLSNPKLIRKYEYSSNFLGTPVEETDDWCLFTDENGIIIDEKIGGKNCYQLMGIAYFDAESGARLASDIAEVFSEPDGKRKYWSQVALIYKKENYKMLLREYKQGDIVEIDSFAELKKIDSIYDV